MSPPGRLERFAHSPIPPAVVLLAALVLGGLGIPVGAGSSSLSLPAHAGPTALTEPPVEPRVLPAANCTGWNQTRIASLSLAGVAPNNLSNGSANLVAGPAPLNISFNLTIVAPPGVYNFSIDWGDGSASNGSVNLTTGTSATAPVSHYYVLPAFYDLFGTVYWACGGSAGGFGFGTGLDVFGPGGPNSVTVSASVTSGPVPLTPIYSPHVTGAPANATAEWQVEGGSWPGQWSDQYFSANVSANFTPALTVPGTYTGELEIWYPGANPLLYAIAYLPSVNVTSLASIGVAHTSLVGNSPWNLTFWGNASNLSGGPYTGNATVVWSFPAQPGPWNGSYNPEYWTTGPNAGPSIWQRIYFNDSGFYIAEVVARLVAPDGVTIAVSETTLDLHGPSSPGPELAVSVSPTSGAAPLFFNLSAELISQGGANLSFVSGTLAVVAELNGTATWNRSLPDWLGDSVLFAGVLTMPGSYLIQATAVLNTTANETWTTVDSVSVTVFPGGPSGPALAFAASPANGSAPLNVTLELVAAGGLAPYNLSVCTEGPFAFPNGTGPCAAVGGATGWNGSAREIDVSFATPGNYTIVGVVTDASGATSSATATEVVATPTPLAPLSVTASYVVAGLVAPGGATYAFVSTVAGGVAPYSIQWSFGDGTSGSGLPDATVRHTYTNSGRFTAVLTVTDARGTRAESTVGPLVVALPISPSGGIPWWAGGTALTLAVLLGIASAAILGATSLRLAQRREAARWFRPMEEPKEPDGPGPGPR